MRHRSKRERGVENTCDGVPAIALELSPIPQYPSGQQSPHPVISTAPHHLPFSCKLSSGDGVGKESSLELGSPGVSASQSGVTPTSGSRL
jgi:hypothetical protein